VEVTANWLYGFMGVQLLVYVIAQLKTAANYRVVEERLEDLSKRIERQNGRISKNEDRIEKHVELFHTVKI